MLSCLYKELDKYLKGVWDFECDKNSYKCPNNRIEPNPEGVEKFNKVYEIVKEFPEIPRTPSGGVSKKFKGAYGVCYIVNKSQSLELVIVCNKRWYRIIFKNYYKDEEGTTMSGRQGFLTFKEEVEKEGGDLESLGITTGKEVKLTIMQESDNDIDDKGCRKSFDIRLNPKYKDRVVYNAFHVDINSAFMAGINEVYGQELDGALGRAIHNIYDRRKDPELKAKFKAVLNCTQGFFQSPYCIINHKGYALAQLSKAGIEYCYDRVQEIKEIYTKVGCEVIATNTDGIWFTQPPGRNYTKEALEEAPGCGKGLGQFKVDHYKCRLRYRTAGAYEFIENGEYTPVVRGTTKLDRVLPRDKWKWGDIYDKDVQLEVYKFKKGVGIILDYEEIK